MTQEFALANAFNGILKKHRTVCPDVIVEHPAESTHSNIDQTRLLYELKIELLEKTIRKQHQKIKTLSKTAKKSLIVLHRHEQ
jgi:hypothetical protein